MQTQWDLFVKKMFLAQGPSNNGQDDSIGEVDDFKDIDDHFPKEVESNVHELEWTLQRDMLFKRRLVNSNSIYKSLFQQTIEFAIVWMVVVLTPNIQTIVNPPVNLHFYILLNNGMKFYLSHRFIKLFTSKLLYSSITLSVIFFQYFTRQTGSMNSVEKPKKRQFAIE